MTYTRQRNTYMAVEPTSYLHSHSHSHGHYDNHVHEYSNPSLVPPVGTDAAMLEQVRRYLTSNRLAGKEAEVAVDQALNSLKESLLGGRPLHLSEPTARPSTTGFGGGTTLTGDNDDSQEEEETRSELEYSQSTKEPSVCLISSQKGKHKYNTMTTTSRQAQSNGLVELYVHPKQVKRICGFNVVRHLAKPVSKATFKDSSRIPPYLCSLNELGPWIPITQEDYQQSMVALNFLMEKKQLKRINKSSSTVIRPKTRYPRSKLSAPQRRPQGDSVVVNDSEITHSVVPLYHGRPTEYFHQPPPPSVQALFIQQRVKQQQPKPQSDTPSFPQNIAIPSPERPAVPGPPRKRHPKGIDGTKSKYNPPPIMEYSMPTWRSTKTSYDYAPAPIIYRTPSFSRTGMDPPGLCQQEPGEKCSRGNRNHNSPTPHHCLSPLQGNDLLLTTDTHQAGNIHPLHIIDLWERPILF